MRDESPLPLRRHFKRRSVERAKSSNGVLRFGHAQGQRVRLLVEQPRPPRGVFLIESRVIDPDEPQYRVVDHLRRIDGHAERVTDDEGLTYDARRQQEAVERNLDGLVGKVSLVLAHADANDVKLPDHVFFVGARSSVAGKQPECARRRGGDRLQLSE